MPRLVDLPAELVQEVLSLLDPSSFYICLLTNKFLRQHALGSKNLLLHQLAQVPGDRSILPRIREDTLSLLLLFQKRAAKHLFNGVSQMTDINLWRTYPSMDRRISNILPWYDDYPCRVCGESKGDHSFTSKPSNRHVFLEVPAKNAVLQIHILKENCTGNGPFEMSYIISQESLWGHQSTTSGTRNGQSREVLQIAWQGDCPIGLCVPTPTLAILSGHSYLSEVELVIVRLHTHFGPRIQARYNIKAPAEAQAVAALAFTPEGDPTITWQCRYHCYKFVKYSSSKNLDGSHHFTRTHETMLYADDVAPDRITHVQIRRGMAIFFPRLFQMPFWVGRMHLDPMWDRMIFSRQEISMPAGVAGVTTSRQGIYLTQRHLHKLLDADMNQHELCVNAVLKLFISRDEYHMTTGGLALQGAYIVKTICASDSSCKGFDPLAATNGRLYYVYVARLADTPSLENLPTIGLKVAVSPRSYRIALAAWRTLKIYSINPKVFLSSDRSSYGSDYGNASTYCDAYPTNAWRSGYYNNYTREEEHVVLEPVALLSTGVIHAMRWINEDELWALTDEGVCQWNVGVWATDDIDYGECQQSFFGLLTVVSPHDIITKDTLDKLQANIAPDNLSKAETCVLLVHSNLCDLRFNDIFKACLRNVTKYTSKSPVKPVAGHAKESSDKECDRFPLIPPNNSSIGGSQISEMRLKTL
ncbi:hypothetical protein P171DRAFT_443775 [Karstenula rhodostoma CBS 690.94]|uniref:F-box domain-containing protein n=1 Tax=Karstenula rhodostoma CBS 690.94 TaxID=1392251 RepID=A0A9P4UCX4_9PLEO|nr:hypothetical protein P171DRAFT_443775 [Karstenula rhodostoma CBS 690.94]